MSPTSEHEALHRVFQHDRELFSRSLAKILGAPVPAPFDVEVLNVDLTETKLLERRADTVLRARYKAVRKAARRARRRPYSGFSTGAESRSTKSHVPVSSRAPIWKFSAPGWTGRSPPSGRTNSSPERHSGRRSPGSIRRPARYILRGGAGARASAAAPTGALILSGRGTGPGR
jgi:hypothetical protein